MPHTVTLYLQSRRIAVLYSFLVAILFLGYVWLHPTAVLAQTGVDPNPFALAQPNLAATWFVADNETMLLLVGPSNAAGEQNYRLLAINMNGGEFRTLDRFPVLCVCDIDIAASADGEQIVVSDGMRLRMINTEQGIVRNLVTLDTPSIRQVQITEDGQMIAFIMAHDTLLSGTTRIFERGVYLFSGARGAVRQLIGPAGVAQLLGVTTTQVEEFAPRIGGPRLHVSSDGTRATFTVHITDSQPPMSSSYQFLVVDIDQAALRAQVPLAAMPALPVATDESESTATAPEATETESIDAEGNEEGAGEEPTSDEATTGPPTPTATPSPVSTAAATSTIAVTVTSNATTVAATATPAATATAATGLAGEQPASTDDENTTAIGAMSLSLPANWQRQETANGTIVLQPDPTAAGVMTDTESVQIRINPAPTQTLSTDELIAGLNTDAATFTIFAPPEVMTIGDTQGVIIGLQQVIDGLMVNRLVIFLHDADGQPYQVEVIAPSSAWGAVWPDIEEILQTLDSDSSGELE